MSRVPRARGTMDMGVGYNGHVYRHVGGAFSVNQHIFCSVMKNEKKWYLIVEIFILGIVQFKKDIYSEDRAPWTLMSILGHYVHAHGAP